MKLEALYSPNTALAYLNDLAYFLAFLSSTKISPERSVIDTILEVPIHSNFYEKVNHELLFNYMSHLRNMGLSVETILRKISGLSNYFDYQVKNKNLSSNPCLLITKPIKWDKLPHYLNFSEMETLINVKEVKTPSDFRNKLILETLYASGIRISELTNAEIANIDFNRGVLKVLGKGMKYRFVPIYSDLLESYKLWLDIRRKHFVKGSVDNGYLFLNLRGDKLTRQYCWMFIKEYCKLAGITKNISPHTLRHSFATHLLTGGADLRVIQSFLGHSSISTTEIYTHVTDNKKRKTLSEFHPRFKNTNRYTRGSS